MIYIYMIYIWYIYIYADIYVDIYIVVSHYVYPHEFPWPPAAHLLVPLPVPRIAERSWATPQTAEASRNPWGKKEV